MSALKVVALADLTDTSTVSSTSSGSRTRRRGGGRSPKTRVSSVPLAAPQRDRSRLERYLIAFVATWKLQRRWREHRARVYARVAVASRLVARRMALSARLVTVFSLSTEAVQAKNDCMSRLDCPACGRTSCHSKSYQMPANGRPPLCGSCYRDSTAFPRLHRNCMLRRCSMCDRQTPFSRYQLHASQRNHRKLSCSRCIDRLGKGEVSELRRHLMATRIQTTWRCRRARKRVQLLLGLFRRGSWSPRKRVVPLPEPAAVIPPPPQGPPPLPPVPSKVVHYVHHHWHAPPPPPPQPPVWVPIWNTHWAPPQYHSPYQYPEYF
jgi:hypothetical protein